MNRRPTLMNASGATLALAMLTIGFSATPALADSCTINGPGVAPTYGAFAAGGIDNSYGEPSCSPGVNSGDTAYYFGTDDNMYTYHGSPEVGSASGSIGTDPSGLSSASANLGTGDITVSASSVGNPPYSGNPLPAGAQAGYFVNLVFSGGQGEQGSVSMGGLMSYFGDVSVSAGLDISTGGYQGLPGSYGVVSGPDLAAATNQTWSVPTQTFTIDDGVTYTLVAYVNVMTASNNFKDGNVTVSDPLAFDLPTGVTFTASDPQFLSVSATPLPASLPLFGTGLGVIGLLARRRRQKSAAAA